MASILIVLGAGASKDCGLPLLGQVFSDTEAQIFLDQKTETLAYLKETFWEARGLSLATADSGLNIEEILTLLYEWEHGKSVV